MPRSPPRCCSAAARPSRRPSPGSSLCRARALGRPDHAGVAQRAVQQAFRARVRGARGARAARMACKGAAVAATKSLRAVALLGTALVGAEAGAVTLPDDQAEAMVHIYEADGLRATGPAVLVRKKLNTPCRCRAASTSIRSAARPSTWSPRPAPSRRPARSSASAATTSTATARSRSPPRRVPSPTTRPARSALTWRRTCSAT